MTCFKILHLKPFWGVWLINREGFVSCSNNHKYSLKRKQGKQIEDKLAEEMCGKYDYNDEVIVEVVDEDNFECENDEIEDEGGNEENKQLDSV